MIEPDPVERILNTLEKGLKTLSEIDHHPSTFPQLRAYLRERLGKIIKKIVENFYYPAQQDFYVCGQLKAFAKKPTRRNSTKLLVFHYKVDHKDCCQQFYLYVHGFKLTD